MKTHLIIIRHGETAWNQAGRLQGHQDIPLNETGRSQAEALALRLTGVRFSALYSSDLLRAYGTATCIADRTGHDIIAMNLLRERNYGLFEGLTSQELEYDYPEEFRQWRQNTVDFRIPGGESYRDFHDRVVCGMLSLAQSNDGSHIVAVTHAGLLHVLLKQALGIPLEAPRRFVPLNASISVFEFEDGLFTLKTFGDVAHLESAARSS